MMRETAIVLGATGAVGKLLVKQLSQREDVIKIILITRREIDAVTDFPEAIASKISNHIVNFAQLEQQVNPLIPPQSVAFIALGTTQKSG